MYTSLTFFAINTIKHMDKFHANACNRKAKCISFPSFLWTEVELDYIIVTLVT